MKNVAAVPTSQHHLLLAAGGNPFSELLDLACQVYGEPWP